MEERRVESLAFRSYLHWTDHSRTQDHVGCDSYGPVSLETCRSSTTPCFDHYTNEPSSALLMSPPTDAIDLWALEEPLDSSPLSTCSSISHTERAFTPFHTDLPVYSTVSSPVFQQIQSPVNNVAFSDRPEYRWKPILPKLPSWNSQLLRVLCLCGSVCDETLFLNVGALSTPDRTTYDTPISYSAVGVAAPAPFLQDMAIGFVFRGKDSDSVSDCSKCVGGFSSHLLSFSTTQRCEAISGVMKLERWGPIMCPVYTTSKRRHYQCLQMDKNNSNSPCSKRFARPEHLKRHVETVHSDKRCHSCKVCKRTFSRRDNLRDHYWTHLKRGGRPGKNRKMSLLELNAILGPMERRVVERLRCKLIMEPARKVKAKL